MMLTRASFSFPMGKGLMWWSLGAGSKKYYRFLTLLTKNPIAQPTRGATPPANQTIKVQQ